MEDRPGPLLAALRPAIKTGWGNLLREIPAAPSGSASLICPEMMVLMLDHTLDRLAARLTAPVPRAARRRDLSPFTTLQGGCHCGLHLLLGYYRAGAIALQENLPDELGAPREEMLHHFDDLAHDEMSALCALCQFRGGPQCSRQAENPVPAPPA